MLIIKDWEQVYAKIPEINYLGLVHDELCVAPEYVQKMNELFAPRVFKSEMVSDVIYDMATYTLPADVNRDDFEFEPMTYVAGGLLGDFIHQLCVVNQYFLKTGRKGVVYLSNQGDPFRNGLDGTYKDTYRLVMAQPYIKHYLIHRGQPTDINLSTWRGYPGLGHMNWYHIFKNVYGVEWGLSPWLRWECVDPAWQDMILVNTTELRFMKTYDFKALVSKYKGRVRFICFDESQYDYFCSRTGLGHEVPCHRLSSIEELLTALKSCKTFVGSFSAPFALAMSMHVPCISDPWRDGQFFRGLERWMPIGFNCMPDELRGLNLTADVDNNN